MDPAAQPAFEVWWPGHVGGPGLVWFFRGTSMLGSGDYLAVSEVRLEFLCDVVCIEQFRCLSPWCLDGVELSGEVRLLGASTC